MANRIQLKQLKSQEGGAESLRRFYDRRAALVEHRFHPDEAVRDALIAREGGGDARLGESRRIALSLVA